MKQRLTEMQDFRDPDEAEAARLLRSLSPAAANELAERRVYARICAGPSRGPRVARIAVLVTALLVSTTILSATLARSLARWFGPEIVGADAEPAVRPAKARDRAARTRTRGNTGGG